MSLPRLLKRAMSQNVFDPADITLDGLNLTSKTYILTFQTLSFGIYAVLLPLSTHILLKRGLDTRANMMLLCAIFTPFVVSAVYWVITLVEQIVRIRTLFVDRALRSTHNITSYSTLFNALVFINYIFGDGVVVWRAFTLCKEYRRVIPIPIICLVITSAFVFAVIGIRVASFFTRAGAGAPHSDPLIHALDIVQVGTLVWSFLTNLSATLIISHKAWRHRQTIKDGLRNARRSTQAERVLALLIETGMVYLISSIALIVFMLIRLPYGTIGDIYTPVNLQIAGIYPTLVIVLVGLQKTLKETTFWHPSEATAHSTIPDDQVGQIRSTTRRLNGLVGTDDSGDNASSPLSDDIELAAVRSANGLKAAPRYPGAP